MLTDLVQARLLTADTGTDGSDTVEISHEALLSAWPRLREWLSQDRAGQRTHRDLTDAARAWQAQGREPSHLFGGARLAVAREWAASHGPDLNPDEHAFLAACQQHQQRATRRRRTAVAALAVLTLVSISAAGLAFYNNSQAVTGRTNQAIASAIVDKADQLQSTDPSLAAQLELVARRLDPPLDNTSRLLGTATIPLSNPLPGPAGGVDSVAFSPDGHTLAAGGADGKVWLWNVTAPAHATPIGQPLPGPTAPSPRWRSARTGTPWPPAGTSLMLTTVSFFVPSCRFTTENASIGGAHDTPVKKLKGAKFAFPSLLIVDTQAIGLGIIQLDSKS